MLSADGRFREQGVIRLSAGSELRFRTVGTGISSPRPTRALRHGSVIWELDGGTGRFEHASGRISSSFTVSDDGCVDDDQHGLIFLESERKDS